MKLRSPAVLIFERASRLRTRHSNTFVGHKVVSVVSANARLCTRVRMGQHTGGRSHGHLSVRTLATPCPRCSPPCLGEPIGSMLVERVFLMRESQSRSRRSLRWAPVVQGCTLSLSQEKEITTPFSFFPGWISGDAYAWMWSARRRGLTCSARRLSPAPLMMAGDRVGGPAACPRHASWGSGATAVAALYTFGARTFWPSDGHVGGLGAPGRTWGDGEEMQQKANSA